MSRAARLNEAASPAGSSAEARPAAPHRTDGLTGRAPDFFVVGQPKTGTTSLHDMLRRHPQIFMPATKEPWFFAEELQERTPPRPDPTPRTLDEYLALFAPAAPRQRIGEVSPMYLWSRTAAARIAEVQPHARIVAILREPASLLRSLHMQFVETYVETENDLRAALALEDARREGRGVPNHTYWPKALMYSEHVRYVEQLRRYEERFGAERVLVLIYDDYRRDNAATMREVLRFVGVRDEASLLEPVEANRTVRVRSQRAHALMHALTVGRGPVAAATKTAVKALTPRGLRRRALHATQSSVLYGSPEPPDEELMAELRRRYRDEVLALGEHLDRDLMTLWGYDERA